ncbi:MAG: thioredoxin family protein, partial [Spirochaetales bacterium]|nr:thioredoxin family protein [Spirochaetales bacterium]
EFSPQRVSELTDEGTPLFLAFSAEWCTSCKVNERTVLDTERGRELFEVKKVVRMKGDLTVSNEESMEWIYSHGRAGVPLYLLYLPGEEVQILPEVLSFQILEDAFAGLPDRL